jgi:type II secretory pathway predicted ATPase ExeA
LLDEIAARMKGLAASGRTLVVLCDEAQALPGPKSLEELRLLTNFQTDERSLVSILLVGQDELLARLRHPSLRSLRQRIGLRFRLTPLAESETDDYLRHRLAAAGASDPSLFEPGTAQWLHRLSQGIPRLLNTLATQALVQAMADGKRRVDVSVVSAVERDLAWPNGHKQRPQRDEPWWM